MHRICHSTFLSAVYKVLKIIVRDLKIASASPPSFPVCVSLGVTNMNTSIYLNAV